MRRYVYHLGLYLLMNMFIKLATYNFFLYLALVLITKVHEFESFSNKENIPFSELPIWFSIPLSLVLLTMIPVWIWVLIKMFKSRYWFWFLIVLLAPPISFFVTSKHYSE